MYHIHIYCEMLNGIKQISLNVTTLWMILCDPDYYSIYDRSLFYLTNVCLNIGVIKHMHYCYKVHIHNVFFILIFFFSFQMFLKKGLDSTILCVL